MFSKIINSGQSGTELAALGTSLNKDLKTGGFIPKGYTTVDGQKPELKVFDLVEMESDKIKDSVDECIREADGIIFFRAESSGKIESKILELVRESGKPLLEIDIAHMIHESDVERFVIQNKIDTVYITGTIEKNPNTFLYRMILEYLSKSVDLIQTALNFSTNRY